MSRASRRGQGAGGGRVNGEGCGQSMSGGAVKRATWADDTDSDVDEVTDD